MQSGGVPAETGGSVLVLTLIKQLPGARAVHGWLVRWRARRRFRRDFAIFGSLQRFSSSDHPLVRWQDRRPCLGDRTAATSFDRHYVYHTAWAARVVRRLAPAEHVDIGSSLYFAGVASAFVAMRIYDYRPAQLRLDNLHSGAADLLALPFADGSIPSLSCMHVVEHVGLGRYGDPLDPDGDLKALAELQRVVAPGGVLLLVVPIGRPRIEFNAHRVYSRSMIEEHFSGWRLEEFALIPERAEQGGLVIDPSIELVAAQHYGCGCFLWWRPTAKEASS